VKHGEVAVLEELASGGVAALLAAVAKRAGTGKSVALVGHEPQLSSILTALAHLGPEESSKLDFRKGAIVRLDVSGLPDAKTAQPRWWVKPRSGARAKGLPLQKPPPPARPARAAKRGKAAAKKAGTKEAGPPARPRAARRARRPTGSPAAKAEKGPADRTALPRPVPRRAATPRAQSFMGSPRHQGGTAQSPPAQPAPAPAPSRPAESVVPPHDGSGSGPARE
jgi:hypothetical protein